MVAEVPLSGIHKRQKHSIRYELAVDDVSTVVKRPEIVIDGNKFIGLMLAEPIAPHKGERRIDFLYIFS